MYGPSGHKRVRLAQHALEPSRSSNGARPSADMQQIHQPAQASMVNSNQGPVSALRHAEFGDDVRVVLDWMEDCGIDPRHGDINRFIEGYHEVRPQHASVRSNVPWRFFGSISHGPQDWLVPRRLLVKILSQAAMQQDKQSSMLKLDCATAAPL